LVYLVYLVFLVYSVCFVYPAPVNEEQWFLIIQHYTLNTVFRALAAAAALLPEGATRAPIVV